MPEQANNQDGIFGSTANVNGQSAIESVQAEEIRRLQQQKVQAEAAVPSAIPNPPLITPGEVLSLSPPSPVDVPLTAAQMMQEASQEAQARTDAAVARAAQFDARSAAGASRGPMPLPPSAGRTSFDAVTANARAAAQGPGFSAPPSSGKLTSTALANAPALFDGAAYEASRHTGYFSDPALAPSPSYSAPQESVDLWTSQNNNGRVDAGVGSASPEMRAQLESLRTSAVVPRAGLEEASHPTYASYEAAQQAKADILSDARNLYASRGEYDKIGKSGFLAEIKAAEISQGLQEARPRGLAGAAANMREDFAEPYGKLNYGYALAQIGQEGGQYYEKTNSGQYLTPEQQQTAAAGALPGIGALAGTAIGSLIAPGIGSWVGGMIGGGAGSAASGVLGAGFEREQSVRQTSDVFGTATGASTDALKEFADTLRSTSAATKEMQTAFTTLSTAGPGVGAGTLSGAAFMSGALGERYNPALSGLTHALSSDPLLRSLQPSVAATGGRLTTAQLGDIATAEAFSGDYAASTDAATLAEGTLTSPQYAADMNRHASLVSPGGLLRDLSPLGILTHPFQATQDLLAQGRLWTGQDDQYVPGADAAKARIAKDRADAFRVYTTAASAQEVARTGMGLAGAADRHRSEYGRVRSRLDQPCGSNEPVRTVVTLGAQRLGHGSGSLHQRPPQHGRRNAPQDPDGSRHRPNACADRPGQRRKSRAFCL